MNEGHQAIAEQLEQAMKIIEQWMLDGADRTDVLRRLGLQIAVMRNEDAARVCRRCQRPFTWTAKEQRFYRSHGFPAPTHCGPCRKQRRAERRGAARVSRMPDEG